jgi:hypothetical protein
VQLPHDPLKISVSFGDPNLVSFGHTKVQGKTVLVGGFNALAATICTPQAVPVIATARLCGGNAPDRPGACTTNTAATCTGKHRSGDVCCEAAPVGQPLALSRPPGRGQPRSRTT